MEIKKINRTLTCKLTGREIIVKPDKYERLLAYYQSEDKVKDNFVCYQVEKQCKEPELNFWFLNSIEFNKFKKEILNIIFKYNESNRTQNDVLELQSLAVNLLDTNFIKDYLFLTGQDDKGGCVTGIIIKNIPFLNEIRISNDETTYN